MKTINDLKLSADSMYSSILEKDASFDGVFFTAVKTTGIFCRPSCTARKPKKENVEFFATSKEAILKGYRPCKVCKPLEKLHETPDYIKNLLDQLNRDPSLKFKNRDLIGMGIDPDRLRRWFMKHHGMTYHAYQRMLRINTAFSKIKNGETVTSTAFDSGYDSLSGFTESFRKLFGVSPKNSREKQVIRVKRIESPLGTMYACATDEGICLLEFTDRRMLETELKDLTVKLNAVFIQGDNEHLQTLEAQLSEYFNGTRKHFTVSLVTTGSDFQKSVWDVLQQIPYGTSRSYREQAAAIGKPEAVRAVANANGMNKIAILIPCHRVIGSDGSPTGYGGGIWRKKYLLELEKSSL